MKGFPDQLRPENVLEFPEYKRRRILACIRRHIFETILNTKFEVSVPQLSRSYNVDLTTVNFGLLQTDYQPEPILIETLCKELQELGWETSSGYGGSTLFIWPKNGTRPSEAVSVSGFD